MSLNGSMKVGNITTPKPELGSGKPLVGGVGRGQGKPLIGNKPPFAERPVKGAKVTGKRGMSRR